MYQPGTILELREPRSTEEEPFAYDRVKVLGKSPVLHAATVPGQWQGIDSTGILIQPAGEGFAPNLDEPLGKLQELYEIVEVPDSNLNAQRGQVVVEQPGPSPEEVFKANARAGDTAAARKRVTTPLQNDGKSPEQVLQEADLKARQAAKDAAKSNRRRTPKAEEEETQS